MKRVAFIGSGLLVLLVGCTLANQYVYEPAVQSNAQASGYPAAYFQIPAEKPTGDVRIASFGINDIQAKEGGPKTRVLHIRMIVANNQDDTPWTIDTREVVLALDGEGTSRAAFVNTDAGEPPLFTIARGKKAILDLYYPLPPNVTSAGKLPTFDLLWQVNTGTGPVVQRTPFERERVEQHYAYGYPYGYPYGYAYGYPYWNPWFYGPYGYSYGFSIGLGPFWWYDTGYPYYGFHHHPGVVVPPGHPPHGGAHVDGHGGYGGSGPPPGAAPGAPPSAGPSPGGGAVAPPAAITGPPPSATPAPSPAPPPSAPPPSAPPSGRSGPAPSAAPAPSSPPPPAAPAPPPSARPGH